MGAVGSSNSGGRVTSDTNDLIELWSTNPPQEIEYEEVQDIQSNQYGFKTDILSDSERQQLADIIYNEVISGGATANNTMTTVQNINDSAIAQIKLGGLSSDDLKTVARMAAKIHTTASMFAFEDILKLLAYYS